MKTYTSKFLLTAIAYIIPTMILGYVWHLIIFRDLYDSLGIYNRTDPIIPLGFSTMIIQGFIIAYLYPFYLQGKPNSVSRSITFNLILGLFLFSVSTLANAAKINVTSMSTWLLIQAVFHFVQFTIAGILIGIVNKNNPRNI
jgi:hypothetical protein